MDQSFFDGVWEKIHTEAAKKLTNQHEELTFYSNKKHDLYIKYEGLRKDLKKEMQDGESSTLDRHKVAALLAQATLAEKPLKFSKPADPEAQVDIGAMLANERMALHVALSVVSSFILTDAHNNNDQATIDIFSSGVSFPPCNHGMTYEIHLAKALYSSSKQGVFDCFFFANILFLLEAYTRQLKSKA